MPEQERPTDAPLIGDFKGPKGNKPRRPKLPEDLQRNDESTDEGVVKSTAQTYAEHLGEVGLSLNKARLIRDNMLFHHYHEETYLLGNKLPVVLRTRDYGDAQRAMRRLEDESPQYAMAINDLVAHCNMAASLSKYGDTSFDLYVPADKPTQDQKETSFEERSNFLRDLPTTIVDNLMRFAGEFDAMIAAVFSEGAPEDF